jgi:hypothetical protein
MDFNLQQEWANVSDAPLTFISTVVLVGVIIWGFLHFLNKAKIDRLEQDVKSEQAENARLRVRLDDLEKTLRAPAPTNRASQPVPAAPSDDEKRKARQAAAVQLADAKSDAHAALGSGAELTPSVAKMESALLTLRKVYGIDTPKSSYDQRLDLQSWFRFLDDVWPLLEHGHIEEGRQKAAALTARLNAEIDEDNTPI